MTTMATYSWRTTKLETKLDIAEKTKVKKIDRPKGTMTSDELLERAGLARKYAKEHKVERDDRHARHVRYTKINVLDIEEGGRVILSNESRYTDSPENPKESGPWSCVGTVLYRGDGEVEVEWDNQIINHYSPEDLIAVDSRYKAWTDQPAGKAHSASKKKYTGKFKVDTLVFLVPGFYSPQQSNPCLGSKHQCAGRVSRAENLKKGQHRISVHWSNGARNSYTFSDKSGVTTLILADDIEALRRLLKGDPNLAFKAQFNQMGVTANAVAEHLSVVLEGEKV